MKHPGFGQHEVSDLVWLLTGKRGMGDHDDGSSWKLKTAECNEGSFALAASTR